MSDRSPIRRALLGVYDKTGVEELAAGLAAAGVELVSTGATARRIAEAGMPVHPVEQVTGFPECLDGRVKTLHPAVHAGILADRRKADHVAQLEELGIAPFDLVVVNLYPFTETVASGASPDECVEQIDIGGPAMVRAAAKNHPSVAVVVDPARYADVLAAVAAGGFTLAERQKLAAAAFRHTAPTTSRSRRGWATSWRRTTTAASRRGWAAAGSAPTSSATARTRTRRRRSTAAGSPVSRTPSSCTARRCPTTTTSTPTPPGGPRTITPTPAWRSSSTPTRAGSPSAPTSPRRTARRTPATRSPRSAASSRPTGRST